MTILVPIDDSPTSAAVLPHAVALARASGNPLHVIRVLDPKLDIVQGGDSSDEVIASVQGTWEEALFDRLSEAGGAGRVSVPVMEPLESTEDVIARTADGMGARAIVMGSHGAGLLRRAVLGSVAMGIVSRAPCPVAVIGPRAEEPPAAGGDYTIVIADDGSEGIETAIDALRPLLDGTPLKVILLHLYEPRLGDDGEGEETDRALRRLEGGRAKLPDPTLGRAEVRTLPDFERVDAALLRVAGELGAQAVALVTRGHSTTRHILSGSVAVGLLKNSPLPVVLVRRD